jgi:hypothetical protein
MTSITGTLTDGLGFITKECRTECLYTFRVDHYPSTLTRAELAKAIRPGWWVRLHGDSISQKGYIFKELRAGKMDLADNICYEAWLTYAGWARPHDEADWICITD